MPAKCLASVQAKDSVRATTPTWVHMQLTMLDPKMLTSPDGKRVEVDIEAVCKLVEGK